ncbi:uncharacterized protein LOC129927375 [Biomphalaria glabrata]|uniref:Uncharacterized protein LOC129927375 n=1 Tax=Biomphalaria glabrata TaxID=6526 RepID=A0A9W3AXX0_BIOGL|nr:uncharacterized protein LOC129927375 [Biomphalaria glabrata]
MQELYLHTKLTSFVCKVTSLHSFVISISENVKELNSHVNILLVDCITKCLKSTLTAIENLKVTESVGVKRHYSDIADDNPVPSKASKSELSYHAFSHKAMQKQNSRDIGVDNIPHLFPNTTISTEGNDNVSVSNNIIRDCVDMRMSSREVPDIQNDSHAIPSVNTLNLDPEVANNKVTTDGIHMTTTVSEEECVLNISSNKSVLPITRASNFHSGISLSSDLKEFGSLPRFISSAYVAPSRVDNTSPMIPPRSEFIPIRQSSSASLDSSDSKNSSLSLDGDLCPEYFDCTPNCLSTDCNLNPSSLLNSLSAKLTNFTEIDSSPDSKPNSIFDDSTVNDRSSNINSPLNVTRSDSIVHEHSMFSTDHTNSNETDITTSLVDVGVNFPWSRFDKTADLTNQMSQYVANIDVSILCKKDESKLLQQYLLDDNDDLSVFYTS